MSTEPEKSLENRWDAELYDDKHAFVWQHGASLIEWLEPKPGERILDIGCGTGHLTAQIASSGAEAFGLDASPKMVARAWSAFPHLRFDVGDARDFTVEAPVDAVFSNAALHWIPEPERVVASIRLALKPGGRFVAEFGGRGNVRQIVAALKDGVRAIGLGEWHSPWYFPGIAEYASLLEANGLEVVRASLFDRPTQLCADDGIRRWVEMFANDLLDQASLADRERLFETIEQRLRPTLFRTGAWFADYRRLRVVAYNGPSGPGSR